MRSTLLVFFAFLLAFPMTAEQTLLDASEWEALRNEISGDRSWKWVSRISEFDRNIGSEGYMDAVRYIEGELKKVGITDTRVVDLPYDQPSWTGISGEMWMKEPMDRMIGSFADSGTAIAINSRSADVTAELIDLGVGGETEADYQGKSVSGKIVMSCGKLDLVYRLAVFHHGAAGVVTCVPRFPGPAFEFPNHIGWQTIPPKGENGREPTWGFSISLRTAESLREILKTGKNITLHVKVEARSKTPGRQQVLIGTIPGASVRNQAIVYTAHLDHMRGGANDDASGCANLIELARAFVKLSKEGKIRKPARDIQFWFSPENFGEYAYFAKYPEDRKKILLNINQEMVGENQTKLGSTALFERAPWSRPTWLNDALNHFVQHVFDNNTGMINGLERFADPLYATLGTRDQLKAALVPFYPSSDHEVFVSGPIGLPAVHFTSFPDYNLHSNQDTIYNVDATQLRRFALIAGATGYFSATAGEAVVPRLVSEVTAGSMGLVAKMSGLVARRQDARMGASALRMAARYGADCVRSISLLAGTTSAQLIQRSADRVEAQGKLAEEQLRDLHKGLPSLEPTAAEAKAAGRTPEFVGTIAEIHAKRKNAAPTGLRMNGAMMFELENLIDGHRNGLEIFRSLHAESIYGGQLYYGTVTLEAVMARLDALVATGAIRYR